MEWAIIPGFKGYEASDTGLVRNARTGKTLNDCDDGKNGYRKIKIYNDAKVRKWKYVHRLVWQAYNPNMPLTSKMQIDHMDGNRLNNTLENLIGPVTPKQNNRLKEQREKYLFSRNGRKKQKKANG